MVNVTLEIVQRANLGKNALGYLYNAVQFWVFFFQPHHRRTGEYDVKGRVLVVTGSELMAPVAILENLVYQQYFSTSFQEFTRKVCKASLLEIKIVQVDIQAGTVCAEMLLGILKKKSGLSYPSGTFYTDKTVVPVYLVHEGATDWSIGMLNKVSMGSIESLH